MQQRFAIDFPPCTRGRALRQRAQRVQRDRAGKAEQGGRKKMPEAVCNERLLGMQRFGSAAHEHNTPGMNQIDEHAQAAYFAVLSRIGLEEQREQEQHHQWERQVHAVVPLHAQPVQQEPLRGHQHEHAQKAKHGSARIPFSPGRAEQQKQRRKENPVAGIGKYVKKPAVECFEDRNLSDQAVIAVPAQPDQI